MISNHVKRKPFYFEVKDVLIQFISAFDDIIISRYNKERQEQSRHPVRYVYSPKQRVVHDLTNKARHITLPVVAVSIKSIDYDKERVFNKIAGSYHNRKDMFLGHEMNTVSDHMAQPTPVDIEINMSILTKYQSDMDQILSNFIPYNNPYIVVSWKTPPEILQTQQEIRSEVIWSGSMSMEYPTELSSDEPYRISADTSFTIKSWLFKEKRVEPQGNIFTIHSFFTPLSGIDGLS